MRHVSMKSVNFLDLETMVAHTGRAPLEGEVTGRRCWAIHLLTVFSLLASPNPNPSCYLQFPHLSHGVHQSLDTGNTKVRAAALPRNLPCQIENTQRHTTSLT